MAVSRIRELDIDHRPLFTGICGSSGTSEYFIENDLRKYNLREELYLYLRELGYIVIFYNDHNYFHSYEEEQLAIFWRLKNESSNMRPKDVYKDVFANIPSPFQRARKNGFRINQNESHREHVQAHYAEITESKDAALGKVYRIENDERIFDRVFSFVDAEPGKKLAVIITNPDTLSFDKDTTDRYIGKLNDYISAYVINDLKLKLIALYPEQYVAKFGEEMESYNLPFFYNKRFKELLFPDPKDVSPYVFFLPSPDEEEVGYWLNRRRILDRLDGLFSPLSFKKITHRLWQDMTININNSISKEKKKYDYIFEKDGLTKEQIRDYVNGLSVETAWDKLNAMSGIDNVRTQFEQYVEDLRRSCEDGRQFLPHMVLEGNPGTGKTTLARLFAEILHEEGVLPRGHVVEATVADMEGEYIGATRPKTQELCQRAKGGVLFIDEAYGLDDHNGPGEHGGYGKDAIEVLIQHMANNTDSVVILAGYQKEMEDMLNNVNPGLSRRLNQKYGKFVIDDYPPETLRDICLGSLKKMGCTMTPECEKQLYQILVRMYQMRDKNWGNAGNAEQVATIIYNNHCRIHKDNPKNHAIDSESLEKEWLNMISNEHHDDTEVLKELHQMIGMDDVKKEIEDLLLKVRSQRDEMAQKGKSYKMDIPLNFIIMGNPGTGKTTLAGILARILKNYGVLSNADVTPVTKDQLVSPLVGQGGKNVDKIMSERINGVLFIDEAYQLAEPDAKDAVTALVNNLTNPKFEGKILVILAGYYHEMQRFIDTNSGLSRRFKKQIVISDYADEDLWQILLEKAARRRQWNITEGCYPYAIAWFSEKRKAGKRFGNAGECDTLIDEIDAGHNRRIYQLPEKDRTLEKRHEIIPEDFPNYGSING